MGLLHLLKHLYSGHSRHIHVKNYRIILLLANKLEAFSAVGCSIYNLKPVIGVDYITKDPSHECRVIDDKNFFLHFSSQTPVFG